MTRVDSRCRDARAGAGRRAPHLVEGIFERVVGEELVDDAQQRSTAYCARSRRDKELRPGGRLRPPQSPHARGQPLPAEKLSAERISLSTHRWRTARSAARARLEAVKVERVRLQHLDAQAPGNRRQLRADRVQAVPAHARARRSGGGGVTRVQCGQASGAARVFLTHRLAPEGAYVSGAAGHGRASRVAHQMDASRSVSFVSSRAASPPKSRWNIKPPDLLMMNTAYTISAPPQWSRRRPRRGVGRRASTGNACPRAQRQGRRRSRRRNRTQAAARRAAAVARVHVNGGGGCDTRVSAKK